VIDKVKLFSFIPNENFNDSIIFRIYVEEKFDKNPMVSNVFIICWCCNRSSKYNFIWELLINRLNFSQMTSKKLLLVAKVKANSSDSSRFWFLVYHPVLLGFILKKFWKEVLLRFGFEIFNLVCLELFWLLVECIWTMEKSFVKRLVFFNKCKVQIYFRVFFMDSIVLRGLSYWIKLLVAC